MKLTKEWKKIKGDVGLLFVCNICGNESLVNPDEISDIGCPVCPDCDEDMEFDAAYIRVEKKSK